MSLFVSHFARCSHVDGPGLRTVVFFKGCPLRCAWCHNPETQMAKVEIMFDDRSCFDCGLCRGVCPSAAVVSKERGMVDRSACTECMKCIDMCPSNALYRSGTAYSVAQLFKEIKKDELLFRNSGGGVTFSGGEPLAQDPDMLLELLSECKKAGYTVSMDTCGAVPWGIIDAVRPYVDLFLYDIKHSSSPEVQSARAIANLKALSEAGARIWIRLPLIPGFNTSPDELQRMGEVIRDLRGVDKVSILPFHRFGDRKYEMLGRKWELQDLQEPTEEDAQGWKAAMARACGREVTIGG